MPELVVASMLTVVVAALTLSALVGPIETMRRATLPDERLAEVEAAAEVLARTVRAARPGLHEHGVLSIDRQRILLRVGTPTRARTIVVELADDHLVMRTGDDVGAADDVRILVRDVAPDGFVIGALDPTGQVVDDADPGSVAAVVFRIEVDGHDVERTIALRRDPVHAQVAGW